MEWQAIETAPKDGTWVLGYIPRKRQNPTWRPERVMRWNDVRWIWDNGAGYEPTHWMPLPSPPKADA